MKARVSVDGKDIVLVGTAHVSDESVDEVNSVIREEGPDTVAVELDRQRYDALRDQTGWKETDIAQALEDGNGSLLLVNTLLSIYQRRLGDELDVTPGADMLAAVTAAEDAGHDVALIDRDISDTLRSALDGLSIWEKTRLSTEFVHSLIGGETVSPEDVEDLKDRDALTAAVEDLGARYPSIRRAFVDERNAHMAQQLRDIDGDTVVAVVGAAHLDGIREELERPSGSVDQPEAGGIDVPVTTILQYGIPALVVGMLAYIFVFVGIAAGTAAFGVWFLLNGTLAAAGALAARSHPGTVTAAFLAAPFTSINPVLPAGLVAAYAENRFRPPTVDDLESIGTVDNIGAFWTNSALKLVLVFTLVNIGSSIASYVGAGYLAQIIV